MFKVSSILTDTAIQSLSPLTDCSVNDKLVIFQSVVLSDDFNVADLTLFSLLLFVCYVWLYVGLATEMNVSYCTVLYCRLRFADISDCSVPITKTKSGDICVAGPLVCSSVSESLRTTDCPAIFTRHLKSILVTQFGSGWLRPVGSVMNVANVG